MNQELTASQIDELTRELKSQKQALQQQMQDSQQSSAPVTLDQQSVGRVSRIDAIQQQQMAVANREQANTILKLINSALERIGAEEYGYCLECGEPIGYARLQVQPQSPNCMACQSLLERP